MGDPAGVLAPRQVWQVRGGDRFGRSHPRRYIPLRTRRVEPFFRLVSAQASTGVPISFGVLTTDSIEQAIERSGTKAGNKGGEAAMTALVEGSERRGWARPRVDRVSFASHEWARFYE